MQTNIIYNEDCLVGMNRLADESIDMIFADLPFGTTARNKWDVIIPYKPLWEQYERIIKPNGAIVLWAQSPFDKILACSNLALYRYEWIVEFTQPTGYLNAKRMPLKCHCNVLVFYKQLPTYNPQMTHNHPRKVSTVKHKRNSKKTTNYGEHDLTTYDSTSRYPRDVLRFKKDTQKSAIHATQKPVIACEYFIKTYTNEGEVVLDNCIGSGSAAIACLNINRKYIGFENDIDIFNDAMVRINDHINNK